MYNRSFIYSFFVPEFIEAQRTSFLKLLKEDIPAELEKHNPIELNIQPHSRTKKRVNPNSIFTSTLEVNVEPFLSSNRVQLNKHSSENVKILKNYLTIDNYLINYTTPDEINPEFHFKSKHKYEKPLKNSLFLDKVYYRERSKIRNTIRGKNSYFLKRKYELSTDFVGKFYIFFHFQYYKLLPPTETIQTSILKSKTYSTPMYVPIDLKNSSNQILLSQWVLLGNLPVMTNRGHFIINGTARVILHQLVRSPGVYFHQAKNKKTHYADIICQRGVWLRLEIDKKGLMWIRMKNIPKIPMIAFLQTFGLEHPHFLSQLHPSLFSDKIDNSKPNTITRNLFRYSRQARLAFDLLLADSNGLFGKTHISQLDLALKFFRQKLSPKSYDLGKVGRLQLNRKLGLNKTLSNLTLTLDDFICIVNYLMKVQEGQLSVDDIDHLKNRRVRCSGELIANQFSIGLIGLERLAKRERQIKEIENLDRIKKILNTKPINGSFKEFFNSSQLSQFMDQTNPLAEITHKRRLSSLGPGGITRETAGMKIRGIHPSHYGRICPIETPEGPNAGLVNSLTTYSRINENGFLETPFYKVLNGQCQEENQIFYFAANQDEFKHIAPPDLRSETLGFLRGNNIPIRVGNEFSKTAKSNVEFMSVSRIQMISVATSLIPFLEHNDANRALMGSNMQRQSVPLIKPERAIVGTGLEGRILSDSGQSIQAYESGLVLYASGEKIQILSFLKTQNPKSFSSNKEIYNLNLNLDQKNHDFQGKLTTYHLQNFTRSNQNTCLTQRPLVNEGDWVEKGTCLTDCASSELGELAIGKNILVAYLPWEGYNFEDAILVSERLVYDDLFTSIHIVRYKTEIRETKYGLEKVTREIFQGQSHQSFSNLDMNGIVKLGTWVREGDILVRKVTPIGKQQLTPYQKFLYVIVDKQIPSVKDTSLRVPKGLEGRIIDIQIRKTNHTLVNQANGPESVFIWIAEKKWLQVGDKMAGRHGNKGIVSQILPRQDMPYLPDGTPIDMVLNPLGVPSRMNVGQIFENLLGLAGRHLNQAYKIFPFDEISGPEASRSLTFYKLYQARKKTGKKWLFQPDNPGKMRIFDGRTGEPFDQPVTVGQAYMLKLIHLVDEKIHARATGPYSLVTQQPLRGRSKHGGQRFGEMEVWALEGFGAAYTLQEILTIKSDDIYGRQQIMNYLFKGKPIQVGRPESFRVLIRELQALCLAVQIFDYPVKDDAYYRRDPIDLDSPDFNQY